MLNSHVLAMEKWTVLKKWYFSNRKRMENIFVEWCFGNGKMGRNVVEE